MAFSGLLDPFGQPRALVDQKGSPQGIQKHPARSHFGHSGAALCPVASKTWPVALKTSSVALKNRPPCNAQRLYFLTECYWMFLRPLFNLLSNSALINRLINPLTTRLNPVANNPERPLPNVDRVLLHLFWSLGRRHEAKPLNNNVGAVLVRLF